MKYFWFLLFIFLQVFLFSQHNSALNKDSVTKNELIYFYSATVNSSTNWSTYSGQSAGSATSRSLILRYKVGIDGDVMSIGRRGKNLKKIIRKDSLARNEFNRAYKVHLRKKRICNTIEVFSYLVTLGSAVTLFFGLDEDPQLNGLSVAGGLGTTAGFASILIFKNRTDRHMDDFAASLAKSVEIYNTNLLKKCN